MNFADFICCIFVSHLTITVIALSIIVILRKISFKKQGGKYFLCRYAGCMSSYAKCNGKEMVCRKEIVPISYEYAKRWARHHMRVIDYIKHFGLPSE